MPPTIADVTAPGDVFAIGELLTENPDIYLELERLVPLGDRLLPFFWIADGSVEHIEAALEAEPTVDSMTQLTEVKGEYLYQVSWTAKETDLVNVLLDTEAVILEGKGMDGTWELRLRFPDHERFRSFNEQCEDREFDIQLQGVYNPHTPTLNQQVTKTQWQTLAVAFERGYFDVPRRTSLSSLADHFGVSEQAISQRLRRGNRALISWLMFNSRFAD